MSDSRLLCQIFIIIFFILFGRTLAVAELTAGQIVKKVDSLRRFGNSFSAEVTITTIRSGQILKINRYQVFSTPSLTRMLAKFIEPKQEAGKAILLLDRDTWIYLPEVGKPARIPPSQFLQNDIAYADLFRINFIDDYISMLKGADSIGGVNCYLLELAAKKNNSAYGRIKFWVNKNNFQPLKAEYSTALGRLIKIGFFDQYRSINGLLRPTRVTLIDAVTPQTRSILKYTHVKFKTLPEKLFDLDSLKQNSR